MLWQTKILRAMSYGTICKSILSRKISRLKENTDLYVKETCSEINDSLLEGGKDGVEMGLAIIPGSNRVHIL